MRALVVLAVASVMAGCAAPLGALPLPGQDHLGAAAPTVEGRPVPVARTSEAGGLLVHVHAWRYAAPGPERGSEGEDARYVILDVSVRRTSPDAPTVTIQRFGVHALTDGEPGPVFTVDPRLTKLLPRALPAVVQPPVNVTVRGDVLAAMPPGHAPWRLVHADAPVVDLATPGDAPAPPVNATPRALAPDASVNASGLVLRVRGLSVADAVAQHEEHVVLALAYAFTAERVEDARGVSLNFLLRGTDGRLYAASVSETPEWWDGTSGRTFEPGREYEDVAWLEAPASARTDPQDPSGSAARNGLTAPFEAWYAYDAGEPIVWGPLTPST